MGLIGLQSTCWLSCVPSGGFRGGSSSFPFPASKSPPPPVLTLPPSSSNVRLVLLTQPSLGFSPCISFPISVASCDYVGPTPIIRDNLPVTRSSDSIKVTLLLTLIPLCHLTHHIADSGDKDTGILGDGVGTVIILLPPITQNALSITIPFLAHHLPLTYLGPRGACHWNKV